MARLRLPRARALVLWAVATALVLLVGGFLFATSGLYNVGASIPHWPITRWFLQYSMARSVETHSRFVGPAPAPAWRAGEDAVRLGAAHFHNGCAFCHGEPGDRLRPVARSMRPAPPDLGRAAANWSPEELFWIVRNGLKYTGMPHWPAKRRDDEVWPVVAFLQRLPELDAGEYRRLAVGDAPAEPRPGEPAGLAACASCHGDGRSSPASRLVPRLDLLSGAVIEAALRQYADGSRPSGVMRPLAARLDEGDVRALADYYAGQDAEREPPPVESPPADQLERGRRIAEQGLPGSFLPACSSCHFGGARAVFPRLAGQSPVYLAGQLRLWQRGGRSATPTGELMAVIAKRLTEQQAEDVAAYYGSLSGPEAEAP